MSLPIKTKSSNKIATLHTFATKDTPRLSTVRSIDREAIALYHKLSGIIARGGDVIQGIERFESELPDRFKETPVSKHYFGDKVTARETFIKANTIATGRIHLYDHICIMLAGHVTMWTPTDGLKDVYAPCVMEVKRGMKRAGYCHVDSHWVTVHGTTETSTEALFDTLTVATYAEYEEFIRKNSVESTYNIIDMEA